MNLNVTILVVFLFFISCEKKGNKIVENTTSKNIQISKKVIDTLIIKYTSAIIYEPTENSINKRKKEVGEEDFYIGADDYLFYLNESNKFLETQEIKIVQTKNDKFLKFISNDKTETIINLNWENEIWGIYLFDPKSKPKKIDITATEEEFKNYTN